MAHLPKIWSCSLFHSGNLLFRFQVCTGKREHHSASNLNLLNKPVWVFDSLRVEPADCCPTSPGLAGVWARGPQRAGATQSVHSGQKEIDVSPRQRLLEELVRAASAAFDRGGKALFWWQSRALDQYGYLVVDFAKAEGIWKNKDLSLVDVKINFFGLHERNDNKIGWHLFQRSSDKNATALSDRHLWCLFKGFSLFSKIILNTWRTKLHFNWNLCSWF